MASEAEYERLYQQFVLNGGGSPTLADNVVQNADGTFSYIGTPAQYYEEAQSITLSPSELSRLQEQQAQYNRTQALQTISSEISSNNFSNPYDARSSTSKAAFNALGATAGIVAVAGLASAFNGIGNETVKAAVLVGLANELGIDFKKLMVGAVLAGAAVSMFDKLQNHTNSQVADLPGTLDQVGQLADMNKQFGVETDSCSIFNELMGILSGAFDGVMDFIDAAKNKINDLINSTGIPQLINDITSQIQGVIGNVTGLINDAIAGVTGAIDNIVGQIKGAVEGAINGALDSLGLGGLSDAFSKVKDMFGEIGNAMDAAMNAVSEITNQITNEIAKLTEMAADIANKLKALAMAAAALDPCKLAVLLNVGSPELKGAINQMTAPVTNAMSDLVPTEIDPRADSNIVNQAVSSAKEAAKTASGVPQSPMKAAAKLYSPFDAYLHDLRDKFPSTEKTEDTFSTVPTESGGSKTTKQTETGTDSRTETNKEIKPSGSGTKIKSKAYDEWAAYIPGHLKDKKEILDMHGEMSRAVKQAYWPNEELKTETRVMMEEAASWAKQITDHMQDATEKLSYISETGERDKSYETIAKELRLHPMNAKSNKLRYGTLATSMTAIGNRWNSIKSNLIWN